MRHPLESIPTSIRRPLFAVLLLLTLVVMIAMQSVSGPLTTAAAPSGIISFELARDMVAVQTILDSWDAVVQVRAGFSLGLDFFFLALYSTTIGCACAWLAAALRSRTRWLALLGLILAWGQWLAAILDAIENTALLTMLLNAPAAPFPMVAWVCAVIKFGLVLLGLLFVLIAGLWLLVGRRRQPA